MVHRQNAALTVDASTLASLNTGRVFMLVDAETLALLAARNTAPPTEPTRRFVTDGVEENGEIRMQPDDWLS